MPTMLNSLKRSIRYQEEGATAVEYGIMVALIAAVIVLVVLALGPAGLPGLRDHVRRPQDRWRHQRQQLRSC